MSEQAAARVVGIVHAAELGARDVRNAVMAREALVDERVVRREQVEHAVVALHDVAEEQLGLEGHRVGQLLVVIGEPEGVGPNLLEVLEAQPLRGKTRRQRLGARVCEHAPDLEIQRLRVGEPVLLSQRNELVVGNAAPEEEREARGQLDVADLVVVSGRDVRGRRLESEHEVRTRDRRLQCALDPRFESARRRTGLVERHQSFAVVRGKRPAICPSGQPRDDLVGARGLRSGLHGMTAEDELAARGLGEARDLRRTEDRELDDVRRRRAAGAGRAV